MGVKKHQESIKNGGEHGKASWNRSFCDFDGFWEPSWEAKPSQEGAKTGHERTRKAKPRPRKTETKRRSKTSAAAEAKPRPGHVLTGGRDFLDLEGGTLPGVLETIALEA